MIDFDSLIRMEDVPDTSITLSYSHGYAPPELIHNKREQIGISSDFYELSCILFEKLFGRCPHSAEISGFARYRFSKSSLHENVPKVLADALTQFFRHTLTVRPADRYDNDDSLLTALREIMQLSREHSYKIISNFTTPFGFFIGREGEMDSIHMLLQNHGKAIVQGVGGIGKSSVALHYAELHRNDYDAILHLEYRGSFEELIDEEIQIDELSAYAPQSEKWELFRSLCNEETLVILDNLEQAGNELETDWLSLPCHLIVTTRSSQEQFRGITIQLLGLREAKKLFCHYYKHPLSEDENVLVDRLLFTLGSHTMMTELLGKYCFNCRNKNGNVDFVGLLEAFEKADTAVIKHENVKQVKDLSLRNQSLQKHMDVLFAVFSFKSDEIVILQSLALIPLKSVSEKLFSSLCQNYSSEALESLKESGMLQTDDTGFFKLHPLIAERILANYPPDARAFAYTSEQLTDSLMMYERRPYQLFLKIAVHYIAHMHGADKSLAFLCQTLASVAMQEQSKCYTEKVAVLLEKSDCDYVPYFLSVKKLADQYMALEIFDDKTTEEKYTLDNKLLELLDEAIKNMPEYKIDLHSEQIARKLIDVWRFLYNKKIIQSETEDNPFYSYEIKFLEMAIENCNDNMVRDRLIKEITLVYDTKQSYYPITPLAEYDFMSFYDDDETGVEWPVSSRQSQDAAMITNSQLYDSNKICLSLADYWYTKHFAESITIEVDLKHVMKGVYWRNEQWEKYIALCEDGQKNIEEDWLLNLGIAYYNIGNYEKSYECLKKAETYYTYDRSTINDRTQYYLLTLGHIAWHFIDREPNAWNQFWNYTESFYIHNLMYRADRLGYFCLYMCDLCIDNKEYHKAGRFLGLFARFDSPLDLEEEEAFEEFLTKVDQAGRAAFWCKLLHASLYYQKGDKANAISICETLLQSSEVIDDERYCQLVYYRIYKCDRNYFLQYYANKIDFKLLHSIKRESKENENWFAWEIHDRLYNIVEPYREIDSMLSEALLEEILEDTRNYDGDGSEMEQAMFFIENYYIEIHDNRNKAIKIAQECYNVCKGKVDPEKLSKICRRIAEYYQKLSNSEQQLHWLQTALDELTVGDDGSETLIKEAIEVHDRLLTYYEEAHDALMQLSECHDIETLLLQFRDKSKYYMNQLIDIYHKLSELYLQQLNLTQAYYYSTLEEELVQKRTNKE